MLDLLIHIYYTPNYVKIGVIPDDMKQVLDYFATMFIFF